MKKDRSRYKMTDEDLQTWIHLRKKAHSIRPKKGKGSYSRQIFKSQS